MSIIHLNLKECKRLKLVAITILLTLVSYIILSFANINKVMAQTIVQKREPYTGSLKDYPGYTELIEKLQKDHPNWKFTIFYTGLDWNQTIKMETTEVHGRNVVPASKSDAWKCSICGDTPRGGTSWRCASEATVCYYMDPRNWLNDTYIFEFENLAYNKETQKVEGVEKIISNMKYMQGDKITYTNTEGNTETIEKTYAQVIFEAAQEAGISPYHLASRLNQEQGGGSRPGSTATGTYPGYVGYYNYLNIKASGSTDAEVIVNGLAHAKSKGWTNPEISIKEGAKVLASNYINDGQDTLYLQKFDVDNSDGTLYYFQYMQNVSASVTESLKVKKAYDELGFVDNAIEFVIPVYENMPETPYGEPKDALIVTQNIKIKGTEVNVRSGTGTGYSSIAEVNTGDTLLRIEKATITKGGYYWDKVVLPNGTVGYVARNYIVEIEDITNTNETVVANTSTYLRNGPGLNGTTVVTILTKGQALTKIETGKYNLDGFAWERVKLEDGRQGYIQQKYLSKPGEIDQSGDKIEIVKVICKSGLKIRKTPGISGEIISYAENGDFLTRIKANASNENGFVWDQIVTPNGIEGYIARGDSTEDYIEVVTKELNENDGKIITDDKTTKLENNKLICLPSATVETIRNYNSTAVVKNAKGEVINSGNIGTGYTITINNFTCTVVKLGDANGDGIVNSFDYIRIRNYIMGTKKLTEPELIAADANNDNNIDSFDYIRIRNYIMGTKKIEI